MERMTKSEKQVMDLLWSVDTPLSCTEIVNMSSDKTWQDSYVHALINSLIKKGIVKVETYELVSRSYARKFAPACNFAYYHLHSSFTEEELSNPEVMGRFFKAAIDRIEDVEEINQIEEIIKNARARVTEKKQ